MEYGLRLNLKTSIMKTRIVLILVVMEYGLRPHLMKLKPSTTSLNPCCNGIWSQTLYDAQFEHLLCLNPCCNGIWSQTGTFVICCAVVL